MVGSLNSFLLAVQVNILLSFDKGATVKLNSLIVVTHLCVALSGGVAAFLAVSVIQIPIAAPIAATVAGMVAAFAAGAFLARQVQVGFRLIETAIATGNRAPTTCAEFSDLAGRLQSHVQRWIDTASNGREQMREVETLLDIVDRRSGGRGEKTEPGRQLRQMLACLAKHARDTLSQMVICSDEIDRASQRIADGSQLQSDSVTSATRDIEHLSADIDVVHQGSNEARASALSARNAYDTLRGKLDGVAVGMDRIRGHVIASESKNRLLVEHTQEIATIVDAIGEISSRTDMLALNASIESVRAGEFGRGFAVVAEEIRKLAEQTAGASREVTERIEIIQLEMKDAAEITSNERADVDREASVAKAVAQQLREMQRATDKSVSQLVSVSQASQQQLRHVGNLVSSAEDMLNAARTNLSCADETHHKTKTLAELAVQLTDLIEPLARCGFGDQQLMPAQAKVSTGSDSDALNRPFTAELSVAHVN